MESIRKWNKDTEKCLKLQPIDRKTDCWIKRIKEFFTFEASQQYTAIWKKKLRTFYAPLLPPDVENVNVKINLSLISDNFVII